jgi:glycosyltransferase involved in cell wall biosynthesis
MIKVLSNNNEVDLFLISKTKWSLELPYCKNVQFIPSKILLVRWIKTFFKLYWNCKYADMLVLYNPTLHTFPALFLKYFGLRIIVDYVDLQGTVVESRHRIIRYLERIVEIIALKKCDFFITSSSLLEARIKEQNPNAKILLYRGTLTMKKEAKPESKKDNNMVNVMYLGTMFPFSGIHLLIEAFSKLENVWAHLYIIGSGPMKSSLINMVKESGCKEITFQDLTDEQLHTFLKKMDIFVLPYLNHPRNTANFPSKIIEYLWAGRAILTTGIGEISRVLEHNKTAVIVRDNADALREGLRYLIKNKDSRERLGRNARDLFDACFSEEITRGELNSFLQLAVEVP